VPAPARFRPLAPEANAVKKTVQDLRVKIFADGADKAAMLALYRSPLVRGFTTNPTLMRKAGIADYAAFAREVVRGIPDRPISFEVFSDDHAEMEEQARLIANWGPNVYVKVPITNSLGISSVPTIARLARQGVRLNVTALFTLEQVEATCAAIAGRAPSVISIFAGRIADTGVDPCPVMAAAKKITRVWDRCELLWASPREVLNIFQADQVGCDIITVSNDLLGKLSYVGKDLKAFSLETVNMFYSDALSAGYRLIPQRKAA
jgi:transaldolase